VVESVRLVEEGKDSDFRDDIVGFDWEVVDDNCDNGYYIRLSHAH
jgi:hypothetical protein